LARERNGTRDAKDIGWRYPPYLHVDDKKIGPRAYVKVPVYEGEGQDISLWCLRRLAELLTCVLLLIATTDDGPDFAFDWQVSFSPVSPVKAALVRDLASACALSLVLCWPVSLIGHFQAEAYTARNLENNNVLFGDGYFVQAQGGRWAADAQDQAELMSQSFPYLDLTQSN
jgi:hypothetical protein